MDPERVFPEEDFPEASDPEGLFGGTLAAFWADRSVLSAPESVEAPEDGREAPEAWGLAAELPEGEPPLEDLAPEVVEPEEVPEADFP